MDLSQAVGSVRKFGSFLSCLFPFLPRWWGWLRAAAAPMLSRLGLIRLWDGIQSSRRWRALQSVLERFYWRDYSKDLREWEGLPAQGIVLLRLIFLLTVALAVLLPVAMAWPYPPLSILAAGDEKVPVAAWSVVLWLLSFAFGWGCLLGGAAASNRPALLAGLACFAYLFGAASAALPRSLWNLPIVFALLTAAWIGQRRHAGSAASGDWRGLLFCVPAGSLAGVMATVFTPLGNALPGRRLAVGLAAGMAVGLGIWAACRRLTRRSDGPAAPPLAAILVLSTIGAAFLVTLAGRAGLAGLAENLYPLIGLWGNYLWPVWYFIGIGVIFKLLKHARILTAAAQELVPLRFLAPAVGVFVLSGTAVTWSESFTSFPFLERLPALEAVVAGAYHRLGPWLWSQPLRALTADWLKWVFLFDLAALAWMTATRRLTGERLGALLFKTFVAWLLIYEYLFEYFSFARSGAHSALVLFLVTVWVLWLTHVVGLKFSGHGTPHWPQEGRLALYGAVLLFVLLNLHARAAAGDPRVVDEVFLYLFRGIVDVGLPYFLYVYAGRQLKELPVTAGRLFAAFSAGALLTLPFNVLDRLAAAGSWAALRVDLDARLAAMYAGNSIRELPLSPDLPAVWVLTRGVIFVSILALLAAVLLRRLQKAPGRPAAVIFLVTAFGTGVASFAKARMTLPFITGRIEWLLSPFVQSGELDIHLLAMYLAYGLPALALAMMVTARWGAQLHRWAAGVACAAGLHFLAVFLWPAHEPWLRSTGLVVTLGLAGAGLCLMLIRAARRRIEAEPEAGPGDAPARPAPLARPWVVRALAVACALALGIAVLLQVGTGRVAERPLGALPVRLSLPVTWQAAAPGPPFGLAEFVRASRSPLPIRLRVTAEPCPPGGRRALLQRLLEPMGRDLPEFGITRVESWNGWFPGAYAVDFTFSRTLKSGDDIPVTGTLLILPGRSGTALVLVLTSGEIDEWERARWELARTARALRGRW